MNMTSPSISLILSFFAILWGGDFGLSQIDDMNDAVPRNRNHNPRHRLSTLEIVGYQPISPAPSISNIPTVVVSIQPSYSEKFVEDSISSMPSAFGTITPTDKSFADDSMSSVPSVSGLNLPTHLGMPTYAGMSAEKSVSSVPSGFGSILPTKTDETSHFYKIVEGEISAMPLASRSNSPTNADWTSYNDILKEDSVLNVPTASVSGSPTYTDKPYLHTLDMVSTWPSYSGSNVPTNADKFSYAGKLEENSGSNAPSASGSTVQTHTDMPSLLSKVTEDPLSSGDLDTPTTSSNREDSISDIPTPVTCGLSTVCKPGEVCCNDSCGICTEPGGFCIQLSCHLRTSPPMIKH